MDTEKQETQPVVPENETPSAKKTSRWWMLVLAMLPVLAIACLCIRDGCQQYAQWRAYQEKQRVQQKAYQEKFDEAREEYYIYCNVFPEDVDKESDHHPFYAPDNKNVCWICGWTVEREKRRDRLMQQVERQAPRWHPDRYDMVVGYDDIEIGWELRKAAMKYYEQYGIRATRVDKQKPHHPLWLNTRGVYHCWICGRPEKNRKHNSHHKSDGVRMEDHWSH